MRDGRAGAPRRGPEGAREAACCGPGGESRGAAGDASTAGRATLERTRGPGRGPVRTHRERAVRCYFFLAGAGAAVLPCPASIIFFFMPGFRGSGGRFACGWCAMCGWNTANEKSGLVVEVWH